MRLEQRKVITATFNSILIYITWKHRSKGGDLEREIGKVKA